MVLNFVTPHTIVYKNKQVEKVTLPGEAGENANAAFFRPTHVSMN